MTSTWTLEGELIGLAKGDGLTDSLRKIGLLAPKEKLGSLDVLSGWHRSGAETYALSFTVLTAEGTLRQYMLKACVASPASSPLAEVFKIWLERRATVSALGISTPVLHATGKAVLVEEHIPYTLGQAIDLSQNRTALLTALGSTAACLVRAGFAPLSSHDWRSRGTDVVLIDFGQDLGPANLAVASESGLFVQLRTSGDRRSL
jgi:hypothetical protein